LTDLVAAVNSVIAAVALVALVALSASLVATALVAGVGFVLALAAHAAYLEHRYHGTWVHPLWRRLVSSSSGDRSSSSGPREIESTLVVVSETPEAILHAIEGLDEVAGYGLADPRPERIHDRYLDTAERELKKRKIALRVRELDGRVLLTLKGPSAVGQWGSEDRGELEVEWSEQPWKKVRAELERHGVSVRAVPDQNAADALDALATAGLEIVQDREAQRRIRDVNHRSGGPGRVAELALDTVTYHLSDRDVRHYEVEIEAKSGEGAEAVAAVTTALTGRYWPWLRPWHHGKLATGQAVAALVGDGRTRDLVGRDGSLEPSAYDAIAEALERGAEADAAPVAAD
jgi:CYTH domain-containing protein